MATFFIKIAANKKCHAFLRGPTPRFFFACYFILFLACKKYVHEKLL